MRGIKIDGIRGSVKEPIVIEKTPSGCWICISHAKTKDGYPRIRWDGKSNLMHRFFYAMYKGKIPQGMCVCHTCDNPACVNPDHLFLATSKQNTHDRHLKNRSAKGEGIGTSRLRTEQVKTILNSDESYSKLARNFGVSKTTIADIKKRKQWTHMEVTK